MPNPRRGNLQQQLTMPIKKNNNFFLIGQAGQTLIETLVAIFILVTGVTSALGLAVYALSTSTGIVKQIVATGLAREGLEAVKHMRDTNWLQQSPLNGTPINTDCYNYIDGTNTAWCYKNWLGQSSGQPPFFCLDPTNNAGNCNGSGDTGNYFLNFDMTLADDIGYWTLYPQRNPNTDKKFGLLFDKTNNNSQGFYNTGAAGVDCANNVSGISEYCRKVIVSKITNIQPFLNNQSTGPLVYVQSRVWWVDKNCPRVANWDEARPPIPSPSCRLELNMYLTNWKDY